jgi:hypothetical protein
MKVVSRKECPNIQINLQECTCTYANCEKRGNCCKCVSYHKKRGELPGCFFPSEIERTYDRTIDKFVEIHQQ